MNCYYHPENPLVNFCNNPTCALPLCSKCVNVHLSQSDAHHQLIGLNQAIILTSKKLQTASVELANELKILREELQPISVLKDYQRVLAKNRIQTIESINMHYDNLERDFLAKIRSVYSQNLPSLIIPIEEELAIIDQARKNIKLNDKAIQTLIVVVSEQQLAVADHLLNTVKNKKQMYRNQLLRLQDEEGEMLKITTQKKDVYSSDRYAPAMVHPKATSSNAPIVNPIFQNNISPQITTVPQNNIGPFTTTMPQKNAPYLDTPYLGTPYPVIQSQNTLGGISRIAQLQAQLQALK